MFDHAVIHFTIIKRRVEGRYLPRDEDNALASLKSAIDGMTDAQLWKADSPQFLTIKGVDFLKPKASDKRTGVIVTIEEAVLKALEEEQ
jgi:Holliday junction resolvase RusA-like endonuclease